jgi:hypothetical protein
VKEVKAMRETKGNGVERLRWFVVLGLALAFALASAVLPSSHTAFAAPDGEPGDAAPQKILFTREGQLWLMNADGTGQTHLDVGSNAAVDPSWSPDGAKIAFICGLEPVNVCTVNADGSGLTQLTFGSLSSEPAWSPDGTRIAFTSYRDGGDPRVYVMDADGGNQTPLAINHPQLIDTSSPAWSPDGSRVAFTGVNAATGDTQIYTVEIANPANVVRVTNHAERGAQEPAWSPDGLSIAFSDGQNIYVVPAGGGPEVAITTGDWEHFNPAWSPDGTRLAFRRQVLIEDDDGNEIENTRGIATASAGGGSLIQIELLDGYAPAWKPAAQEPEPTPTPDDNQPPVAVARNAELAAGADGTAHATAGDVDGGSYDPDASDTVTLSLSPTGPFGVGTHAVQLTATDNHGASSTASATVSVVDRTPPTVTALPAPQVLPVGNVCSAVVPNLRGEVEATDNVTPVAALVVTQEPSAGATLSLGTHFVTLTVSDAAGNQTQRFVNVSVVDDVKPTVQGALFGIGVGWHGVFNTNYSARDNCTEGLQVRAVIESPSAGQHFPVVYEFSNIMTEIEFDLNRGVTTLRGFNEQAMRQLLSRVIADGGARVVNGQLVTLQKVNPRNRHQAGKHAFSFNQGRLAGALAPEPRMLVIASDSSHNTATLAVLPPFRH